MPKLEAVLELEPKAGIELELELEIELEPKPKVDPELGIRPPPNVLD